ncbi:TfoX/Sxy family DNA transformation protein [Variovorax sp. PCZ-1]|uniref:TfoX/Sxy family DNA transformation protein n=1 Tax=Variovorax sp. PCZ-1 TaxID=2835533 RepID=UPI001BCCCB20|nr:TfoX/Sxy family DNA transformation protein [Variovorax sp. PCZ-1]MBS7807625.1 TfoX/Sxy family DNA transformation protein [Variovorax sp. PCZ-1]
MASNAFARIEADVLRLAAVIPRGRITSAQLLGQVIDVPARHVAYIVSRLDDTQREKHALHRICGSKGEVKDWQVQRLADDGVAVKSLHVADWPALCFEWDQAAVKSAKPSRTTRPPEHARQITSQGTEPALSELRGLGSKSVELLVEAGINTPAKLRKANLFKLYERIKAKHPRTSLNLLYAMIGAVGNTDWRDIAKDRRSEILMRLDDMGLL